MKPQQKAKEIAESLSKPYLDDFGCGEDSIDKNMFNAAYNSALQMHRWTKEQVLKRACKLMQHWILEHDYVDIMELEDYIKQQMEE